jgi:FKBP-type peptidyl-prolyl cis-trans isomerase
LYIFFKMTFSFLKDASLHIFSLWPGPFAMMGDDDGKEKPSLDDLRAQEEERHRAREAEIDASWSKTVVTPGTGKPAWPGARATLHMVGTIVSSRSGEAVGSVIEDTRTRGEPHLLLLGRGVLVPGLEKAVQSMREGELATVTVQPSGGYGGGGSPSAPRVPGSAVLRYELELLSLKTEPDLWDLEFDQKLAFARERRERGNRLFKRHLFREADEEYEQGLRYLVYMPQVEAHEKAPLDAEVGSGGVAA